MKLFAYRGRQPNFGDDLNHWLWGRLLPGFLDDDERELFLGIGSILHSRLDPAAKKLVFGTGFGGYGAVPRLDRNWHVYFVRGPQTAAALGIDRRYGIGDAAILVRSCWDAAAVPKRHDVSFMPHFESAIHGRWEEVCRRAGVNFIDPRWDVEVVLGEISASRLVVSEAMHGVIVADALRIPWRAARPLDPANRAKWFDWADSLGISIDFTDLGPSNAVEALGRLLAWNRSLHKQVVFRHRRIRQLTRDQVFGATVDRLRTAAGRDGQLSPDASIESAHAAMLEQLDELRADYPGRTMARGPLAEEERSNG